MAAIIAGIASGVIGAGMSYMGGQAANQANQQINQSNQQFQIEQNLQGPSQRVTGLENAGLNPMLAVSGGGGMFGGYPNPSTMQMQNTMAGAGQSISSIPSQIVQMQNTQAQTRLTNAQAAQTENQTPGSDVMPLNPDGSPDWNSYVQSNAGHLQGNLNAYQAAQNIQQAKAATDNIQQMIRTGASQQKLNDLLTQTQGLTNVYKAGVMQYAIQQAKAEAAVSTAAVPEAEQQSQVMTGEAGKIVKYLQNLLPLGHSAISLGNRIGGTGQ